MSNQYNQIHIEGDLTVWTLAQAIDSEQIASSDAPLKLVVAGPLNGILLLSGKAAARVTLSSQSDAPSIPGPMGWIPGDMTGNDPFLYLPLASVSTAGPAYYRLSAGTLDGLENQIMTAMTGGTKTTVPIGDPGTSVVVLNGDALSFAVIGGPVSASNSQG
jgi:hypothetical protein